MCVNMKWGVVVKACVGSANISLVNSVVYVFGTKLFGTVCIVLCCNLGVYFGFHNSYVSMHVINVWFLLRRKQKTVYFSTKYVQSFNYGKD